LDFDLSQLRFGQGRSLGGGGSFGGGGIQDGFGEVLIFGPWRGRSGGWRCRSSACPANLA
jgi:hypothetical protein